MKAKIVLLTPELAKELLNGNIQNRSVKNTFKAFYTKQMKDGTWKENGEPIIVDKTGVIKDGQHRLLSVVESGFSYNCPLIYDVEPDVMDTIDTGKNRSLSDVLELKGFPEPQKTAAIIKGVLSFSNNRKILFNTGTQRQAISNSMGLKYAESNKNDIVRLVQLSSIIQRKQAAKILPLKKIGTYLFIIAKGLDVKQIHLDFINGILGITSDSNSVTDYVYKKLIAAKSSNTTLKEIYVSNLIIKAWNIYSTNDVPVSRMVINMDQYEEVK